MCPNDERIYATVDAGFGGEGAATARAAVEAWFEVQGRPGERLVPGRVDGPDLESFIVIRPDGTARAELEASRFEFGWALSGESRCSD